MTTHSPDTLRQIRLSQKHRAGFTTIDMITALVIFMSAAVLTAQILLAMAAHLQAKRIDFVARQTTANAMEIASTVPFERLDGLASVIDSPETQQLLSLADSDWSIEVNVADAVTDIRLDAKRIDVVVAHAKRSRDARLFAWRYRTEASDENE